MFLKVRCQLTQIVPDKGPLNGSCCRNHTCNTIGQNLQICK